MKVVQRVYDYYGKINIIAINGLKLYISYETIMAYRTESALFISKNIWGNTTGRHLNWIDRDKKIRIENVVFEDMLKQELNRRGIFFEERS